MLNVVGGQVDGPVPVAISHLCPYKLSGLLHFIFSRTSAFFVQMGLLYRIPFITGCLGGQSRALSVVKEVAQRLGQHGIFSIVPK